MENLRLSRTASERSSFRLSLLRITRIANEWQGSVAANALEAVLPVKIRAFFAEVSLSMYAAKFLWIVSVAITSEKALG